MNWLLNWCTMCNTEFRLKLSKLYLNRVSGMDQCNTRSSESQNFYINIPNCPFMLIKQTMTSFPLQLKHFIDDTLINQINVKTTLSTSLHTSTVNHWWCPSLRGTAGDTSSRSRERNNRAVMPLDVPGRTRATLSAAASILGFLSIHANSFSRIGAKMWNEIWNSLPLQSSPTHQRDWKPS